LQTVWQILPATFCHGSPNESVLTNLDRDGRWLPSAAYISLPLSLQSWESSLRPQPFSLESDTKALPIAQFPAICRAHATIAG
jgi:hypothetical protein